MERPKRKWWYVKSFDVGRELGDPDYIIWADNYIKTLEADLAEKEDVLVLIKKKLNEIIEKSHRTGYDFNADPENVTLLEGEIFKAIDEALLLNTQVQRTAGSPRLTWPDGEEFDYTP